MLSGTACCPNTRFFRGEAIRATKARTEQDLADLDADQTMTEDAMRLLWMPSPTAYARALACLREDTREWWEDQLNREPDDCDATPFRADAESLARFLESKVLPWYETRRREHDNRPLIRAQASAKRYRLVGLIRYEVHLDPKLERTVAMLLKLQELRRAADPS
jgi:hypothetical protein